MEIRMAIGKRIKELRMTRNMTQEQLALVTELDRTYINSVENGKRNISIVNIEKIANGLGVGISYFFNHSLFK